MILLNFPTIQNEPKQTEMKYCNRDPAKTIREQLFFTMVSATKQVLSSPLLDFIYLNVLKMGFTFQVSKVVQCSVSKRAARKANI